MAAGAEGRLAAVVGAFAPGAVMVAGSRLGRGHINDTFLVELDRRGARERIVLQRLNRQVFADPEAVMGNVERVLAHLHGKLAGLDEAARMRRVLTLVRAPGGAAFVRDGDGAAWRATRFIDGAHPCSGRGGPAEATRAARAFGELLRLLADIDGPPLAETIAGFHDTRARLAALAAAVARDAAGRAASCAAEVDFALARAPLAATLLGLREAGLVADRTTHNDTKLDNVLLDDASGEALAVLDLDTVMPGLVLTDFGDLVRSGAAAAAEDEPDAARVAVRPDLFEALARGFLAGTAGLLTPIEVEHLVAAGEVITLEAGVRFLADHLDGDVYFAVRRGGHNLDRARGQLALLRSLERQEDALRRIAMRAARDAHVYP